MKAVGIVVEYNPFHNGHAYHAKQAKTETNADVVIAVMSGQFLQRGEPALVDKWTRTKMALQNGVDIVIELPYVYSTAQATDFAYGAISLLDAIGCETFAFGSEAGRIEPFLQTYEGIHAHQTLYNEQIRQAIQNGLSYPMALQQAYLAVKQAANIEMVNLSLPNNILGYHYIEAAKKYHLQIQPYTIKRLQAGYHDDIDYTLQIASATGIRKALKENLTIQQFMPTSAYEHLIEWQQQHRDFVSWHVFWPLLQYAILRHTPEQLTSYPDVKEGLEHALIKHAKTSDTFEQFMTKLKSKRYTWTRLQRMLTHIYTGFTKEQLHAFEKPSYIRLLGISAQGQRFLSTKKKEMSLPLISRVAASDDPMLALDLQATLMYQLGLSLFSTKKIDEDFKTPPIRL